MVHLMKRFILPIILVGIMTAIVGGLGFVVVKYAADVAAQPRSFTWEEMDKLQEKDNFDDADIPRLLVCFERNDEELRVKAAETLGKMGKIAVEPVREKLKSRSPKVRYWAVQTFAFMDPAASEGAADDLLLCLQDQDVDVRRKAVYTVGRLGANNAAAFDGLIKALSDKDESVVETALEMLQKVDAPPKSAVPALTKLAKDPNHPTRVAAIKLLGKVGEPALPALRELLAKANAEDRHDLYQAILPLGDKAAPLLPELQAYLIESRWWDEEENLFAIFKNCGPAGARGLASVLKSLYDPKSPFLDAANERARTVLKALGPIGPQAKDAVPVLIELLSEHVTLRPQVLETLGDIGPSAKEAIPAVQALTNDPAVGPAARAALKRMGVMENR